MSTKYKFFTLFVLGFIFALMVFLLIRSLTTPPLPPRAHGPGLGHHNDYILWENGEFKGIYIREL